LSEVKKFTGVKLPEDGCLKVTKQGLILNPIFTAGEAISAGDVVYISADNQVKKATLANASKVVGVATQSASAGQTVPVLCFGVIQCTADGAISPGDPVAPSSSTAGRVVALPNHSHNVILGSHDHGLSLSGSIGSTNLSHSHSFTPSGTISSAGSHTHLIESGATIYEGAPGTADAKLRINFGGGAWYADIPVDSVAGEVTPSFPTTVNISSSGEHSHTFTGSPGTTGSSLGSHAHSLSLSGSVKSRDLGTKVSTAVDNARILGKAITSATNPGDPVVVIVTLSG